MIVHRPAALRTFLWTALGGAVLTGGVLIAVLWTWSWQGQPLAGYVLLVVACLAILAAAIFAARAASRRVRDLEILARRIARLGEAEEHHAAAAAPHHDAVLDPIFRGLSDAQERIRGRLLQLDSERRRGFQVLGHMTEGVIAVTADRRVLLLNPAARSLLALTRESLLGRRLAEVVRVPQIVAAVDAVLAGRGPQDVELDVPNDRERWLRVLAIDLPSNAGPGALVTIRDETHLRQLERMRRDFIANVSHELKTPLAAIKGYNETLQLGAKDDAETCTHFLNQIEFQANRLERLINDMLQLARAQTESHHLTLVPVPLLSVMRESLNTYSPLAQARDVALRFTPPPPQASKSLVVLADREALVTIVNNLLGNAIRYTPEGGHIQVSVRSVGRMVAIMVADDGIGIPEADQQRIFERFYRVEKARDATRGGTGLGLSIVKHLVHTLGGEIRLQSQLGKGSTFEVLLPVPDSSPAEGVS